MLKADDGFGYEAAGQAMVDSQRWLFFNQASGIYLTEDSGVTWTKVYSSGATNSTGDVHKNDDGTFCVASANGVLTSKDLKTWTLIPDSPRSAVVVGDGQTLYTSTNDPNPGTPYSTNPRHTPWRRPRRFLNAHARLSAPSSVAHWTKGMRRSAPAGFWRGILVVAALFAGCGRSAQNPSASADGGRAGVDGGAATNGGTTSAGGMGMPLVGGATQDGDADGGALSSAGAADEGGCGSPTDPHNCGRCGNDCTTLPFVNPEGIGCVDGQCSYGADACLPGFARCSETEGCVDDLTTVDHCGACARTCGGSTPYCASPSGQAASCVQTCPPELTECGNQCVDLTSNHAHCTQCGRGCDFNNAAARCSAGRCVLAGCYAGYADCLPDEPGCETYLETFDNCGRCGDSCDAPHAVGLCENNQCARECEPGFDSCDKAAPDCGTSLNTAENCGACGRVCAGEQPLCRDGVCVETCPGSLPECFGACVDLETDASHCGACGVSCEAYQVCEQGACTPRYVGTSFIRGMDVRPLAVDVAADGTLVLSLVLRGTADLDPGAAEDERSSQGGMAAVIAKLNADGSYAWSRVIGDGGQVNAGMLALMPSGAVVAGLDFSGTVDLDPTDGVDSHGAPGLTGTAAVVKLEADGSFAWARSFPAAGEPNFAGSERGAISTDQTGAVYVTGTFRGELQLEPGQPAVATAEDLTPFLLKLTEDGALVWFHVFTGCDLGLGQPLLDSNDALWIGGGLEGSCLMDPSDDGSSMVSLDRRSALLLRWNALSGEFVSGRFEAALDGIYWSVAAGSSVGYFGGWIEQTSTALKIDTSGPTEWFWSRDSVSVDSIAAAPDAGLLIAGNVARGQGPDPQGLFIARVDRTRDPRWSLRLPTRSGHVSASGTSDTHFFLVGTSYPDLDFNPGEPDLFAPGPSVFISQYAF